MKQLNENWLTQDLIDYEYKKYILLAYLREVHLQFNHVKLYPYLSDLVKHYQNLLLIRAGKTQINSSFPKDIKGINTITFLPEYQSKVKSENMIDEIEKIMDFSIPQMEKHLAEGREIFEWIESQLRFMNIGLLPAEKNYGYILFRNGGENKTKVYEYNLSKITDAGNNYRYLSTTYTSTYSLSISSTYETVKSKLVNKKKNLFMPAVFALESEHNFPFAESLLPVAKRFLIRELNKESS